MELALLVVIVLLVIYCNDTQATVAPVVNVSDKIGGFIDNSTSDVPLVIITNASDIIYGGGGGVLWTTVAVPMSSSRLYPEEPGATGRARTRTWNISGSPDTTSDERKNKRSRKFNKGDTEDDEDEDDNWGNNNHNRQDIIVTDNTTKVPPLNHDTSMEAREFHFVAFMDYMDMYICMDGLLLLMEALVSVTFKVPIFWGRGTVRNFFNI